MNALSKPEAEAVLSICLLAAFADGQKDQREREQIKQLANSLAGGEVDVWALYQRVLVEKPALSTLAGGLPDPGARQLAYEMAVAVCDADEVASPAEQRFLGDLREALQLNPATAEASNVEAGALVTVPVIPAGSESAPGSAVTAPSAAETDAMILRYSVVAGALELLPQTMATLAIVPLQTKMVYRIGTQHGAALDKRSIAELMASVGLGLASQVFEGFARKLSKGLFRNIAGKFAGSMGEAATGMAMSFASTYALGQVARAYYESGRSLSFATLKERFAGLVKQGQTLAQQYGTQIQEKSQQLRGADLTSLVKGAI